MTVMTVLPIPDETSALFWEAAREGRFLIQRCPETGRYQWYPRAHSIHAPHATPEWVEASGRGELLSYSIVHRGNTRGDPYTCALVRLEEGVTVFSRIEGVAEADLRSGLPLAVAFHRLDDTISLPIFRPPVCRPPSTAGGSDA
ncbi:OB-fold domain-containing protein [Azospirillum sp. A29]|uniref:Zn-ribbon domain-containing OB-fold protein n=1 Tax=Azospirillum sp. A29 TaxID=3160606 RepID=UPI00366A81AF